ncbi:MAG TPA: RNA polymerase sigma factor RpoD/SigA [Candidatus Andersenbacteria bacterium]|nr:RNA polymerase sigma factor RpoD/SigA [Candidatus Andersenbacteria bacterium]
MKNQPTTTIRDRSSLRQYLEEIGQTPLLTASEEASLARRIQDEGDELARQQMMRANLRLVVNIAKQYSSSSDSEALLDLIQEGNIGLMRAVDRFRPEFKTRFSTYGVYWIRQAILRALKSRRLVRLPENVVDRVLKMQRVRQQLYQTLGRWPTPEEVAQEMKLTRQAVDQLEAASSDVLSLHQPVRGKDGEGVTQLQEMLEDTEALGPNQITQKELIRGEIREAVSTLPPRERKILEWRFGLNGQVPHTLEQIGEEFGISRERVRQLQNVALGRLRRRRSVQRVASN